MRKCALLVLVVVFGWSSGAWGLPANNPITNGLVAAYEFSGNADDVSGNGNDGVVNGATPTTDRFGNASSAYSFDGSSDISVSNPSSLSPVNTVSAWVNLNALGAYNYIIDFGDPEVDQNNNWIEILPDGTFRTGTGSICCGAYDTVPLDPGQWYMLTRSFDGTELRAYVNGVLVGATAASGVAPVGLAMGTPIREPGHKLNGFLDDVYIYNRALSPSEIATLFAVPEPSTALLLGVGLAGLGMQRRTRRGC